MPTCSRVIYGSRRVFGTGREGSEETGSSSYLWIVVVGADEVLRSSMRTVACKLRPVTLERALDGG